MKPDKLSRALFPGSFDPLTLGHIDIVRRFAPFFENLTVLAASSIHKEYWFSLSEREKMARLAFKEFPNVNVDSYKGLTVDYARKKGFHLILRGVRSISDFSYERDIAINNRRMMPSLETFLVFSRTETETVSAKLVKEIAISGGDLSGLVPEVTSRYIKDKLNPEFKKL